MADERLGEHQANTSLAADAEAVAMLRQELARPEVRADLVAVAGGEAEPEPEPTPAPPEPTDEPAGPTAATPEEKPAETTDEGEDYDPESVAEYPEDEDEGEPKPEAKAAEPAPAPTTTPEPPPAPAPTAPGWTDEDREAWEAFKVERAARKPEPPPKPAQQLEEVARSLMDERQDFREAMNGLNARRNELEDARKHIAGLSQEVQKADSEINRLTTLIEYHQDLATKDPDDDTLRDRIRALKESLVEIRATRQEKAYAWFALDQNTEKRGIEYEQGIAELRRLVVNEAEFRSQRHQIESHEATSRKQAREQWDKELPEVLKEAGIPDTLRAHAARTLRKLIPSASDEDISRENLRTWMKAQVEETIAPLVKVSKDTEARALAEAKRRDAKETAPPAERAVAPPRAPRAIMDSREAHKIAEQEMRNFFKGKRA